MNLSRHILLATIDPISAVFPAAFAEISSRKRTGSAEKLRPPESRGQAENSAKKAGAVGTGLSFPFFMKRLFLPVPTARFGAAARTAAPLHCGIPKRPSDQAPGSEPSPSGTPFWPGIPFPRPPHAQKTEEAPGTFPIFILPELW